MQARKDVPGVRGTQEITKRAALLNGELRQDAMRVETRNVHV